MDLSGRNFLFLISAALLFYWVWTPHKKTKLQQQQFESQEQETIQPSPSTLPSVPKFSQKPQAANTVAPNENGIRVASPSSQQTSPPDPTAKNDPSPQETKGPPTRAEIRPDYTAEEFEAKFRTKSIASWLAESRPYNPRTSKAAIGPNHMGSYLIRGAKGESIRYRQSMGLNRETDNATDCASVLLPGGQPIIGSIGNKMLEVRETDVKWTYIIILHKQHHFLLHIDSTDWELPVPSKEVLYYYLKNADGSFQYAGQKVSEDGWTPQEDNLQFCNFQE